MYLNSIGLDMFTKSEECAFCFVRLRLERKENQKLHMHSIRRCLVHAMCSTTWKLTWLISLSHGSRIDMACNSVRLMDGRTSMPKVESLRTFLLKFECEGPQLQEGYKLND